jgi:uncharacterized protein YjeT (DUF2065 family)
MKLKKLKRNHKNNVDSLFILKKRLLIFIGLGYLLLGIIVLLMSFSGITGYVAFEGDLGRNIGGAVGFVFVVVGILVLMARDKESNLEKNIKRLKKEVKNRLKSGGTGTAKECLRYANQLGYEIRDGSNHSEVYSEGIKLTEIPRHSGDLKKGTYRAIMKALYEKSA